MAMAGAVPGIVILALGAGALGGPDALRLLIALAGRNPAVDIGICVFVICMFATKLLGILLLARHVRKPPPPEGRAGARRGALDAAPAADPLACITLLLSLAAASLVTACLVVAGGGLGSIRPLVEFVAKYCYPIAIAIAIAAAAAGAALLYAMPLLRVFTERRMARGRAGTTRRAARFIGLPLVVVAAGALLVAILFGARGGLHAFRLSPGYSNTTVAAVVGSVRPLVDFAATYPYPIVIVATAAAALFLLRVFREPRNARRRAAPAERARTVHHAARFIGGLHLAAAACALLVAIPFGAHGGLDALRLPLGLPNMPIAVAVAVAVLVSATLLVLVHFYRRARNAAAADDDDVGRGDAAAAPRTRRASARG